MRSACGRESPPCSVRPATSRADNQRRAAGAPPAAAAKVETGSAPNQYAATPKVAPRQGSEAAPRSASAASARKSRLSVTPVPARIGRVAARAGTGAAHVVSSLAPRPTLPGSSAAGADNVSTAVLITLLVSSPAGRRLDLRTGGAAAGLAMTRAWTISPRKRIDRQFSVRAWVLAAAACGALVAPGVARAAGSPPGMSMSDLTTTVGTALAQVDAAAPGAGAAAEPAVMQALGAASALSSLARGPAPPAGPPDLPEPTPPTAVAPAAVTTSVEIPASVLPTAVPPAVDAFGPRDAVAGADRPEPAATLVRAAPSAAATGRHASLTPAAATAADSITPPTPGAAPAGVRPGARPSGGRSAGDSPAGATSPRPLPPLPPGPEPGLTAPGQGGVPGPLLPLLIAALAAALAFASFPFVSRWLPRSAFRKPRRVALAVWHPG